MGIFINNDIDACGVPLDSSGPAAASEAPPDPNDDGVERQVDANSRTVVVKYKYGVYGGLTMVTFRSGSVQRRLGDKKSQRLDLLKKNGVSPNQRYVEPKGYEKYGDHYAAGPIPLDAGLILEGYEPLPSRAHPVAIALKETTVAKYSNNASHAPDLEKTSWTKDLGSDFNNMAANVLTWRYVFTSAFWAETDVRLRNKLWVLWHKKIVERVQNVSTWLKTKLQAYRRYRLWSLMGTRPFLRLTWAELTGTKNGIGRRQEIPWVAGSSLKREDGSYLACTVSEDPYARRLQKSLDYALEHGVSVPEVVRLFAAISMIETQMRRPGGIPDYVPSAAIPDLIAGNSLQTFADKYPELQARLDADAKAKAEQIAQEQAEFDVWLKQLKEKRAAKAKETCQFCSKIIGENFTCCHEQFWHQHKCMTCKKVDPAFERWGCHFEDAELCQCQGGTVLP